MLKTVFFKQIWRFLQLWLYTTPSLLHMNIRPWPSQDSLNSISSDQELRSEENIISTWWRALNCYEKVRDMLLQTHPGDPCCTSSKPVTPHPVGWRCDLCTDREHSEVHQTADRAQELQRGVLSDQWDELHYKPSYTSREGGLYSFL